MYYRGLTVYGLIYAVIITGNICFVFITVIIVLNIFVNVKIINRKCS
uniref:Uncharacterized protein n=1 Tax=Anguilla anguilla TaxID=7936 RepID=A0A0E9WXT3_ANGAN